MAVETKEVELGSEVRNPWAKDNILASTDGTREGEKPTSMGVSRGEEETTWVAEETVDEALYGGGGGRGVETRWRERGDEEISERTGEMGEVAAKIKNNTRN